MPRSPKPCKKGSSRIGYLAKSYKPLTPKSKYNKVRVQSHLRVGSKAQVWHGTAVKTAGGLTKKDLTRSKSRKGKAGKIVSKKQQAHGMRIYAMKKVQSAFKVKQRAMKSDPLGFRGKKARRTVSKGKGKGSKKL